MLQRIGGRGTMRNTERGTLEIVLRFPVPFTVFEAALLRTGGVRFAVPAQQIVRFEAFDPCPRPARRRSGRRVESNLNLVRGTNTAHIEMLNQGAKPFRLTRRTPHIPSRLKLWGTIRFGRRRR